MHTSQAVENAGGLHVLQTFLSEEFSEEIQIKGRTARQDKKGTFELVLLESDLEKFKVTKHDISEQRKGSGMYNYLHHQRTRWFEELSNSRSDGVANAKELHSSTVTFQENLVALKCNGRAQAKKCVVSYLKDVNRFGQAETSCRLLCLSDSTASMNQLWNGTKDSVKEMIRRVHTISGTTGNLELMWVAYRDYDCIGTEHPLIEASCGGHWTSDADELIDFVQNVKCCGGGDIPEAIEAALEFANSLDTKPTRILLMGDAPPHAEKKGETISAHKNYRLKTDYAHECDKLNKKGVPVFTFYMHKNARETFKEIASRTNGEVSPLHVNDSAAVLNAVCLQALDDIGGKELKAKYAHQFMSRGR